MKIKAKIFIIPDIKEAVRTGDHYSAGDTYNITITKDGVSVPQEVAEFMKSKIRTDKKNVELLAPRMDGNLALAYVMLDTCKTGGVLMEPDKRYAYNKFFIKPRVHQKPFRHALVISMNSFLDVSDFHSDLVYSMTGIVQSFPLKISRLDLFRIKNAKGDYLMNKRPIEFWGLVILVATFLFDIVIRLVDFFC